MMMAAWWSAPHDRRNGVILSLLAHSVLLTGGAAWFGAPPRYGVDAGAGGIEVSLVAAPSRGGGTTADPSLSRRAVPDEPLPMPADAPSKEWVGADVAPSAAPAAGSLPAATAPGTDTGPVGDGSSPIPGHDPTTLFSTGGARAAGATSTHLRNPAPPYPWTALVKGQEGVVVLAVTVDATGRPQEVSVAQSSGFPLLDDSALKTIRRWRFEPARVGMLAVRASLRIPIRFVIEDEARRPR